MGGGSFLGGALGGFAQGLTQAEQAKDAHKQALSDEEHEQQLADHNNTIASLQQKMAQVGPDHPGYAGYQNQLNQAVADRTALFHPDQPGGAERLGKLIWAKLHGTTPQVPTTTETTAATPGATLPATPGTMGASGPTLPGTPGTTITRPAYTPAERTTRNAQDLAAGGPAAPQNTYDVFRRQLKAALPNMSDEELDNAVKIHAGVAPKPVEEKPEVWTSRGSPIKDTDGNWVQPQFNKAGETRNQPMAAGYEQATKTGTSQGAIQRAEYAEAVYGDRNHSLTFDDEQNMIKLIKQAGAGETSGGHFGTTTDKDGKIITIWFPSHSAKSFGGHQPVPVSPQTESPNAPVPKTPAAAKKAVAKTKGAPKQEGAPKPEAAEKPLATTAAPGAHIGDKLTGPESKARTARDAAKQGYDGVLAAGNGDPTGNKIDPVGSTGIVLSWLRGRVNRVTATEIAAVRNLGGIFDKFDGNVSSITKGTMTPKQYQWFLNSAKQNLQSAQGVVDSYNQGQAGGSHDIVVSPEDMQ